MRIQSGILLFFSMILFAFPANAEKKPKPVSGEIEITGAWARASVSKNGAAYLTIQNHGDRAHLLIGAETPLARKVEIHTHTGTVKSCHLCVVKKFTDSHRRAVTTHPLCGSRWRGQWTT